MSIGSGFFVVIIGSTGVEIPSTGPEGPELDGQWAKKDYNTADCSIVMDMGLIEHTCLSGNGT